MRVPAFQPLATCNHTMFTSTNTTLPGLFNSLRQNIQDQYKRRLSASPLTLPTMSLLLFLEFTITASAIGFTDPHSPLRLACLPLMIALTWIIVTTSIQHMRSPWAALTGGYTSTFLLHYINIALLCKRSYRDRSSAPPHRNNEPFAQRPTRNPQR